VSEARVSDDLQRLERMFDSSASITIAAIAMARQKVGLRVTFKTRYLV